MYNIATDNTILELCQGNFGSYVHLSRQQLKTHIMITPVVMRMKLSLGFIVDIYIHVCMIECYQLRI